jgi:hypothetical protein
MTAPSEVAEGSRGRWVGRAGAVACSALAIATTFVGLRLLFAGDWLDSHEVRYGPLALLAAAILLAVAAVVIALVDALRHPRLAGGWIVLALVILPVPLGLVLAQALGL